MNEDEPSTAFRSWPLIISLFASLLALGTLLYAHKTSQQLKYFNDLHQAELEKLQSTQRLMAQFTERFAKLEQGTQQNKQAIDRVRLYSSQLEKVMQPLAAGVEDNRNKMIEWMSQLNLEAGTKPETKRQVASEDTQTSLEPIASTSQVKPPVHRIASGDNFARIAKAYNIGLQSLLDANPDVDPRRLQIGQEVVLPLN
jgi:LysM repeat protein